MAEGIDGFIGYPGEVPLYSYPVIRERKTFGTSGLPFTLPGVDPQDFSGSVCPVAEKACKETVCMWWTDRFEEKHLQGIAQAIRKVLTAYGRG